LKCVDERLLAEVIQAFKDKMGPGKLAIYKIEGKLSKIKAIPGIDFYVKEGEKSENPFPSVAAQPQPASN